MVVTKEWLHPIGVLCLLALCAVGWSMPVQAEVKTSLKTKYYNVSGRTPETLVKSIFKSAPALAQGKRALGSARLKFDWDIDAEQTNYKCQVNDLEVSLEILVTLPRWRNEKGADPQLRAFWRSFYGFVEKHENRHVTIAKQHATQLERMFNRVPAADNCKLLTARLAAGAKRILTNHNRKQTKFDAQEQAKMRRNARVSASRFPRILRGN